MLALLTAAAPALAQESDIGAWFAFAGQGHFDQRSDDARWRWWFDAHARFFEDSNGFDQGILRPGIGYDLSTSSTLWLGYGRFDNDPSGAPSYVEHRVWQQFTWATKTGPGVFYSRTRLEQRFVETGDDTGWRLRQFQRYTRPLEPRSRLGLRLWDELFFDLNDTDWGANTGFAQNRLFVGLGWTFERAEHLTLEFGYLNQFIVGSSASDSLNHILSAQLLLNL